MAPSSRIERLWGISPRTTIRPRPSPLHQILASRRRTFFASRRAHASPNRCGEGRKALLNTPSLGIPEGLCPLAELETATRDIWLGMKIENGGSGTGYTGCIDDVDIAINRRDPRSISSRKNFKKEVQLSCQLRHPNLVALIGFCDQQGQLIVVSEYMPNSSLHNRLFGRDHEQLRLRWKKRLQICIDVARGLHYLHCGVKYAIVHCNVNTRNILLDRKWVAKLSGFGVSKMGPPSMSRSFIRVDTEDVIGTLGNVEPEYKRSGVLTEKSDVYSFGIVMFEVLSGRTAWDNRLEHQNIVDWVSKCLRNGTIDEMIEPHLKGKIAPQCLHKFVEIAASCVFNRSQERPAMGEVEVSLGDALELQETADSQNGSPHDQTDYTYQYHDMSYLFSTTSESDTNIIIS